MALDGVHTWAQGVVRQAMQLNTVSPATLTGRRQFRLERHYFLIAADQLVEHAKWAIELGIVDQQVFSGLLGKADVIGTLRDHQEHITEYYKGKGRSQSKWTDSSTGAYVDSSATIGSLIGGRLDWNELSSIADALAKALPTQYQSPRAEEQN